uniref:hypothetical protein n=1 Tax=Cohnella massiliensis TaxID=1816691 RepID=UPI001BC8BB20
MSKTEIRDDGGSVGPAHFGAGWVVFLFFYAEETVTTDLNHRTFKEDWLLTACHPGKDRVTEVSPGCRLTKDLMNNDWLWSDQRLIVWTFQSTHPVGDATALQQSPCAARVCKRFGAILPGKSCALGVRTEVRVIHERLIRRFGGSFGSWPASGNGSPFLLVEIVLPSDDVETLGF